MVRGLHLRNHSCYEGNLIETPFITFINTKTAESDRLIDLIQYSDFKLFVKCFEQRCINMIKT